jgi:dUTP pyrophosphatase
MIVVKCKLMHPNAKLPIKTYESDSCFDLYSVEEVIIPAHSWREVSTGIIVEPPLGYGLFLRARSSQGIKGIQMHNGTIDCGYRGILGTIVYNHSNEPYCVKIGDKVGQAFVEPILQVVFEQVEELSESERGEKGFGSSGK